MGVVAITDQSQAGQRNDDYCPVCDAWPRRTQPAKTQSDVLHRVCLICGQVWEDHCDHTPVDN